MSEQIRIPSSFPVGGDVRDKRVVLTGASRGLGRVLAHAFSQAGARLALVARNEADLKEVAGELPGYAVDQQMRRVVPEAGRNGGKQPEKLRRVPITVELTKFLHAGS